MTERKPFTFRVKVTPRGRHYIEVLYGGDVVATGKNTHANAEAALSEVQSALGKLGELKNVIQPNGNLVELLP